MKEGKARPHIHARDWAAGLATSPRSRGPAFSYVARPSLPDLSARAKVLFRDAARRGRRSGAVTGRARSG